MTGYGTAINADHRALYIDVNTSQFLKGQPEFPTPPLMRQVNTKDPRLVAEYIMETTKYLDHHNYTTRIEKLIETGQNNNNALNELEKLDRDMVRARTIAGNKLGKRFKAGWSPDIRKSFLTQQYWVTRIACIRKRNSNYTTELVRTGTEIDESEKAKQYSIRQLRKKVKEAAQALQDSINKSQELRQNFLKERASALASAMQTEESKEVKKLETIERIIGIWKKIRYNFKRHHGKGALSHLLEPVIRENGEQLMDHTGKPRFNTISDLEEIETKLIDRNIKHFGQAHGSPPTMQPALEVLGTGEEEDKCNAILLGDVNNSNIRESGIIDIIKYLKRTTNHTINERITTEDLREGFKNWRESTTTSPSGLDLGHWRASAYRIPSNEDHNKRVDAILTAQADIINECTRRGHILERWKRVHSFMIEKIPGTPIISKLRTIQFFEADLNLTIGIWNRRLQKSAERLRLLHRDQGAQTGNRATDTAMTKKLSYIYSELTRTDFATLDTDAKSCYDRMTNSLVTLRNRQLGMPANAATIQSKFLNSAKFHLATKLGVSTKFYTNTTETPLYGQGQGAKWAPTSWIGISTMLLSIMENDSANMTMKSNHNTVIDNRQLDGYVDDFTSWVNDAEQMENDRDATQDSTDNIGGKLQRINQKWESLLACTGGQLELSKCFYYFVKWKFDDNSRPKIDNETRMEIILTDTIDKQNTIKIKQKHPHEPHRTLGVYISPTENESMAIEELTMIKSNKFSNLIRSARASLTKEETNIFMKSMYKPSMGYQLVATALSEEQCRRIQSSTVRNLAISLGYNRNSPTTLLHAPSHLGGANIPDLYTEQGTNHIKFIERNINGQTRVGKIVKLVLDWFQIHAGLPWWIGNLHR